MILFFFLHQGWSIAFDMSEIKWQIMFGLDFSRTAIFMYNEKQFVRQLSQNFLQRLFLKRSLTTWAEKNIYNLL